LSALSIRSRRAIEQITNRSLPLNNIKRVRCSSSDPKMGPDVLWGVRFHCALRNDDG